MSSVQAKNLQSDLQGGMAYVCALCHKWLRARDKGLDKCEAAQAGKACGGPMAKMIFPLYEGPLESSQWGQFCFRCGEESDAGVQVPGEFRVLGVCGKHLEMLENMTLDGSDAGMLKVGHVDAPSADLVVK